MKRIVYVLVFACFLSVVFPSLVYTQVKVLPNGTTQVGIDPYPNSNDVDAAATLQIFGRGSSHGAASKLTFGDFGNFQHTSWNVFVGEYGTTDTDQLWLHGKRGIYITFNKSNSIIASYDPSILSTFNFNAEIRAYGMVIPSDARLKENINPLSSSLSSLRKLEGVNYFLKTEESLATPSNIKSLDTINTTEAEISDSLSEKEKEDIAFFEEVRRKQAESKLHYGFLAQDLQEVFPDLVREDNDGMLAVDYIGLIPIIVESIKEQQQIIDTQTEKIAALEKAIEKLTGGVKKPEVISATEQLLIE